MTTITASSTTNLCALAMKWLVVALGTIASVTQADVSVVQHPHRRAMGAKAPKAPSNGGGDDGNHQPPLQPYYPYHPPPRPIEDEHNSPTHIEDAWWKGDPHQSPTPVGKGKGATRGSSTKAMSVKAKGHSDRIHPIGYLPPKKVKALRRPDCAVCSSSCILVNHVFLVDSTNNRRLFAIHPGEQLDFDFLEEFYGVDEFSVECAAIGEAGSMVMTDNYGTQTLDNEAPFILAGDLDGDFFDSNFRQNPGLWTVTCQPFCEDDAMGEAGPTSVISFVVGPPGPVPTPPSGGPPTIAPGPVCDSCRTGCIDVVGFVLVDASTNTQIREIAPGETISVESGDQFTVECITTPIPFATIPFSVGSVVFTDNYENIVPTVENSPPFVLAGDSGGDYNPSDFFGNPGPWDVSCQAFCGSGGTGESGPTRSINFNVVAVGPPATPVPPVPTPPAPTPPGPSPPVPTPPAPTPPAPTPPSPTPPAPTPPTPTPPGPSPPVTSSPSLSPTLDCSECRRGCIFATRFFLVNAATDTRIRELVEGETLEVASTDSLAIECDTIPEPFAQVPWPVGSTVLTDNYDEPFNSENSPPWALADDNNGDFFESPLYDNPGEWIVTCQAFCGRSQQGDSSDILTLRFNVVRGI